jgi:hypothetical protein
MDSLTMHYLARELDERWRGRRVLACHLDEQSRALTIWCDVGDPVSFDLRQLTARMATGDPRGSLLRGWNVVDVEAPTDDRRLSIRCQRPGKFRGSPSKQGEIDISFVPNARAVRVRDGRNVLAKLGETLPDNLDPRPVLDDETVRAAAITGNAAALLRGRWMSSAVCDLLIAKPERAADLYRLIASLPAAHPVRCGNRIFPLPLCDGVRTPSLILPHVEEAIAPATDDRRSRALARMQRELERAREAPRLRAIADALMALGADGGIPDAVVLADGTRARVPHVDATVDSPIAMAERLYKEARAQERALETLPARIAELNTIDAPSPRRSQTRPARTAPTRPPKRLPYKSYRSSGGIEILVGRGAKSNDELTYEIAKPDDVWLHARDVTGAHVVLRWSQDGAPPQRDLQEAAALAAWHSGARGSTIVPVDWTRRRHVRRARGGPPGRAVVDRAQTVMARPSAALERRLRVSLRS